MKNTLKNHAEQARNKEIFEEDYSLTEAESIVRALILISVVIGSIFLTIGFFL